MDKPRKHEHLKLKKKANYTVGSQDSDYSGGESELYMRETSWATCTLLCMGILLP